MKTEQEKPAAQSNIDFNSIKSLLTVSDVHLNVSQELIVTTEDKIKLCLSEHLKKVEKRKSWIAPLGILITVVITLCTATFKTLYLEASTWNAIFVLTGIISFIWFIVSFIGACRSLDLEDVVGKLKKEAKEIKRENLGSPVKQEVSCGEIIKRDNLILPGSPSYNWIPFMRKIRDLENSHKFLSIKWLREKRFSSDTESQEALQVAIDKSMLSIYYQDNPKKPKYPTQCCRLNKDHQLVKGTLQAIEKSP